MAESLVEPCRLPFFAFKPFVVAANGRYDPPRPIMGQWRATRKHFLDIHSWNVGQEIYRQILDVAESGARVVENDHPHYRNIVPVFPEQSFQGIRRVIDLA